MCDFDWDAPGPGDRSSRGWTRLAGVGRHPADFGLDADEPIVLGEHRARITAPEPAEEPSQLLTATPADIVALRPSLPLVGNPQPSRAAVEDALARLRRSDPRQLLDAISDMLRDGRLRP